MRWPKPVVAALACLPLLYFNCSKLGSSAGGNPQAQGPTGGGYTQPPLGPGNSIKTFEVLSDGTVKIWQDKELRFSPGNGEVGVYLIAGLPAWASFDVTTGTISGIPRRLTDTGTFSITKTGGNTYGPYTIQIVGDTYKEQQWHLRNTGQTAYALTAGVADQDIHYGTSVKDNLLGTDVRIAVSDTGVYIAHPDLAGNILAQESRNYLNNFNGSLLSWLGDPSPSAADPGNAHGTAVTGLAAAKGWNGIGGRGVAPEARVAGFMFLPAQDKLAQGGLTNLAFYDQFAGNFDIFNFSWGDPQCALSEYEQSFVDKMAAGVTNQRGGKGSVYIIAAGNSFVEDVASCYSNVNQGADFVLGNNSFSELNTTPYSVNIASVAANGRAASYSTPGAASWVASTGGEYGWSRTVAGSPEVSRPALITTDYPGCSNGLSFLDRANSNFAAGTDNPGCNYVSTMNGTSGAAPIASGAVAILLQVNPNLSWRDVKYILAKSADKIDPTISIPNHPVAALNLAGHTYEQGWITNQAGFNFHNWYGFGRLNVDRAVALAKNFVSPLGTFKTTAWKHDSGTINVAIPDNSAAGVTQTFNVTDALTLEAVQLRISTNSCASDTGLELTSPSGTKSILMNINSKLRDGAILNHVFLSNAFYGEPSAGTWTLKVIDGKPLCTAAVLTNWKLNFYGY